MNEGNRFRLTGALFVAFLLSSESEPASASPITVRLTGSVTAVGDRLGVQFSLGDSATIEYTYQSTAVDTDPDPERGGYAIDSFFATIGSWVFPSFRPPGSGGGITLAHSDQFGDRIHVFPRGNGPDVGSGDFAGISLLFRDFRGVFLRDDSLITVAPDLALLRSHRLNVWFEFFDTQLGEQFTSAISVNVESSQLATVATPEPSTAALFAFGLIGLAAKRLRRSSRPSPVRYEEYRAREEGLEKRVVHAERVADDSTPELTLPRVAGPKPGSTHALSAR